jgi:predicted ATPase
MMITRIYIDNFRCFTNFEFKPEGVNLLIGLNGSGKTSLIDLMVMIRRLVGAGDAVEDIFSAEDLTGWDTRNLQRFELDIELGEAAYCYKVTIEYARDRKQPTLAEEHVTCNGNSLFSLRDGMVHLHDNDGRRGPEFPYRAERSFLPQVHERPETECLMRFLGFVRAIRTYKLDPTRVDATSREEQQSLSMNGANFASWYRHIALEKAAVLPDLFDKLRSSIPPFNSLSLRSAGNEGRTRDLLVEMRSPSSQGFSLGFDRLSDGQRAIIILYTLLLDLGPCGASVLFFDEPENYVGLSEIQPWLQCLEDSLGDNHQLFLISHHPEVIDFLAADHPFLFEKPSDGPIRARRAEFSRESGLKASEEIARGLTDAR